MAGPLAEFVLGDVRLQGYSRAGEETYITAPELNIAFDLGRAPPHMLSVDNVFLSHGHMDHAAGLAYYFAQRMFIDNAPGQLYVPRPLVEPIQRMLRAWADIDGHEPPANILPAEPGVDIEVRRNLIVRPYEVNHPCRRHGRSVVRALGFTAIEVRKKLIDEYTTLTGPQLVALKKQGVEITRRVEMPLVTYCGDTAAGEFLALDHVRNSRIILLECTFIEPDHRDRARAGYHIHVSDLREIIPTLNNENILLIHLSRRTPLAVAKATLKRELGKQLAGQVGGRISFFMEHRRRGRRREGGEGDSAGGRAGYNQGL